MKRPVAVMVILGLVLISFALRAQEEQEIIIWIGGGAKISSLPNMGFCPTINAQWQNILLSYGFAAMSKKEAWVDFEVGVLTQTREKVLSYLAAYCTVMAKDIKNASFLSLMAGVSGGIEMSLPDPFVKLEIRGGVGVSTALRFRVWARIGLNFLFKTFKLGQLNEAGFFIHNIS